MRRFGRAFGPGGHVEACPAGSVWERSLLAQRSSAIGSTPRAITYEPTPGSTERSVKTASPAQRGRREATSLDGAEASPTMSDVMARRPERHGWLDSVRRWAQRMVGLDRGLVRMVAAE